MDFWGVFMLFFLTFLIMSCCGYCCTSKRRGTVLSTPVVVTSATHTAPGGYPVTQLPPPGGYQANIHIAPYPTSYPTSYPTAYPAQTSGPMPQMPMPMPMGGMQPPAPGMQPHMAPYPPIHTNPPSYDTAVAGGPTNPPGNASTYEKQSAYNPSFTAH